MPTPAEIRQRYQEEAAQGLPAEQYVLQRNGGITAVYAKLYLEHPEWFKWAGMAAFASARVGLALLPYELEFINGRLVGKGPIHGPLMQELDLLRTTNNRVFADIAWAHFAYSSPDGGIAAVEAGCADLPDHERLLGGFRAIDEGRRLMESSPDQSAKGSSLIWEGNKLLLQQEQFVIVQPAFTAFDTPFDVFLTVGTMLVFNSDNLNLLTHNKTKFSLYMWTYGLPHLLKTFSLPNIRRYDQRWLWIERRALKVWERLDRDRNVVKGMLDKIVHSAAPSRIS